MSSPRKLVTIGLVVVALLAIIGRYELESLFRRAGDLWIVSDSVTRGDAIVVLGGNWEERPAVAAGLYHRGFANRVLVSRTPEWPEAAIGAGRSGAELNRSALLKFGVPAAAVEAFGRSNANTRDEAVALREWAEQNAVSALIIPSELFEARRVSWIFHRVFFGTAIIIEVPSFERSGYTREDWWSAKEGRSELRREFIKYLYYRVKY